jgi:hypothetical protein
MKTSSIATLSGNNFSSGVWIHKGTTLKRMLSIFSLDVSKNITPPIVLLYRRTFYRHSLYPERCFALPNNVSYVTSHKTAIT